MLLYIGSFIWDIVFGVCSKVYEIDINNYNICNLINKQSLLNWLNILNFINFIIYKYIKLLIINISYYIIEFFIIIIYRHMPNGLWTYFWSTFFSYKTILRRYNKYIWLRYIKRKRLRRSYYRFYFIGKFKFFFFFLLILLFIQMFKRHFSYLRRSYFIVYIKFYLLSIIITGILIHLFANNIIGILLGLMISYFIVFIKLN